MKDEIREGLKDKIQEIIKDEIQDGINDYIDSGNAQGFGKDDKLNVKFSNAGDKAFPKSAVMLEKVAPNSCIFLLAVSVSGPI